MDSIFIAWRYATATLCGLQPAYSWPTSAKRPAQLG